MLAVFGFGTSLVRRPAFLILSGLAAVATSVFAASYANADIERYYLVPLFVAITWIGLGVADMVDIAGWLVSEVEARVAPANATEPAAEPIASQSAGLRAPGRPGITETGWAGWAILIGEIAVAAAIVFSTVGIVPERRQPPSGNFPGGVSLANDTWDPAWMQAVLAPADRGGLPPSSVIMSWWSASTTLWYGQRALGLRPDITIIDDSTRVDDNLGTVQDVFNKYLGNRPVFTIRLDGGDDGMTALSQEYDIQPYTLPNGATISQVLDRKGNQ